MLKLFDYRAGWRRCRVGTLNDQVTELLRSHSAYQIDEAHDAAQQARLLKGVNRHFRRWAVCHRLLCRWHDSAQDVAQRVVRKTLQTWLSRGECIPCGRRDLHPLILFDANVPGQTKPWRWRRYKPACRRRHDDR